MKTIFTIKYHTTWGERLYISGSCTELGDNIIANAKEMYYFDDNEWRLEISLPDSIKEITYNYLVEDTNGFRKAENTEYKHHIFPKRLCEASYDGRTIVLMCDKWQSEPNDRTFYSSAFTKNIFARQAKVTQQNLPDVQNILVIQVQAPETRPHQQVALTGNQPFLGNWDPHKALHLSDDNFPLWEIRLNADDIFYPLEYKFVVLDSDTNRLCYWEEGENRIIYKPPQTDPLIHSRHSRVGGKPYGSKRCFLIFNSDPIRTCELSWKACGTVIPVFSLRSEQSFGIGDIGDLKKMIDWAKVTNQHVIQVLPMNDTTRTHTWKDSYPYSAISIYALHPLYINIPMLGELNDKKKIARYHKIQQQLNEKETVDYPSVEKYKTAYYRDYFEQEKDNIFTNNDFQKFIAQNMEWLKPYAAFSFLRDRHQTADFTRWGDDAHYNPEKMENLYQSDSEAFNEFSYLFFIQYILHSQFDAVSRYARENRVILKGDLPIGVNRESVEAWTEPIYFNRQVQAGAPPDYFSEKGQNWSFPTYNWDVMKQDDFGWWKKRLQRLQQYFDSIRIDHILGFFRIWEIPLDYSEGLCGYFNPSLPLHKTEIEQYGMKFDEQWLTPQIHVKYLSELFGTSLVESNDNQKRSRTQDIFKYLHHRTLCQSGSSDTPRDSEHLILNENCATQRKIEQLFYGRNDKKSQIIKDGLMSIANEVLFISDHNVTSSDAVTATKDMSHRFHPRILAFNSFVYSALSEENKQAFDRLYNDYFFQRHNEFWRKTALSRLQPLLKSTEMLICGEDLGMIPATVQDVMRSLKILSLELERMTKDMENEFTDLAKLPYLSVCTTSTHDMNPIRAWWTENKEKTQRYFNNMLRQDGIAPADCSAAIAEQIIYNHLHASSMLTMIPLQDWFAMDEHIRQKNILAGMKPANLQDPFAVNEHLTQPDAGTERINDPANPNHYWRYRMHLTIEALLQSTNFNQKISEMITESGR